MLALVVVSVLLGRQPLWVKQEVRLFKSVTTGAGTLDVFGRRVLKGCMGGDYGVYGGLGEVHGMVGFWKGRILGALPCLVEVSGSQKQETMPLA